MKSSIWIVIGFAALLFAISCNQPNQQPPGISNSNSPIVEKEVELVALMGRMQLFMNKLYFAGINENKELRDFYVHELEETMEEIEEGEVIHEGVNISQNMQMFGTAQLEVFEEALAENSTDFKTAYNGFVNACNSCHTASKYPFIIIKAPEKPVFDNQVYESQ